MENHVISGFDHDNITLMLCNNYWMHIHETPYIDTTICPYRDKTIKTEHTMFRSEDTVHVRSPGIFMERVSVTVNLFWI